MIDNNGSEVFCACKCGRKIGPIHYELSNPTTQAMIGLFSRSCRRDAVDFYRQTGDTNLKLVRVVFTHEVEQLTP